MIESLRAEDLALVTGARETVTPNLDALAAGGVVFPTFTSNGFPSAPSVFSFHCSAWPHRRKEIITDFANRRFDCVPSRLRDFGYDTVYVGADPHFDNQDRWLGEWYAKVIDLVANGIAATDRNIVARAVDEMRRHDRESPGSPLFAFISTYSTHYPFAVPDDAGETPRPTSEGLRDRYRQVLRYTDQQIGTLLAFLAARPNRDRTVTIVVGDHGFYSDLRRTSGLPENDNVWTAAIISGPRWLVGNPRRIITPASHVDMLPTILDLAGDERPTAAVGRSLLGPPRSGGSMAFAVRPGGLRFDRGGYAVMVDARTPQLANTRVAFPGLVAPGDIDATADVTAARMTDWISDWSYLIEKDRVWDPAFLTRR
jgi:arylsulfatase A-like enzyme